MENYHIYKIKRKEAGLSQDLLPMLSSSPIQTLPACFLTEPRSGPDSCHVIFNRDS
jgi:hypothetical protein